MAISLPRTTFCFIFILVGLCHGRLQGLHVIKAPSSEELLAQKANSTSVISVVVDGVVGAGGSAAVVERLGFESDSAAQRHEDDGHGRSIVTSLSQQASNLGKGFMEFLRGAPLAPSSKRPAPPMIMPYPGPPMMRPHPLPHGFHRGRPMPHLTLSSEGVVGSDKDRVGPSNVVVGGDMEGGFLPSKKQFRRPLQQQQQQHLGHFDVVHAASSPSHSSSNSVAINTSALVLPAPKAPCDFYTDNLCIETHPYPSEQMRHRLRTMELGMPSIRRMLADVGQQNANILVDGLTVQEEILYNYEHYYGSEDNNTHSYRDYASDGGFVCPSDIKYVRLQKGRSAHGQWKFIVNFDEFAQTVRLEKCLKPYSRCSYVFSYLNSECIQIYNFHRLLAWDVDHGFHIDVFKIPTACSCHIRSDSNANNVMSDSRSGSSSSSISTTSTSSAKLSMKRKKLAASAVDQPEVPTEKSYAAETPSVTLKSSHPDLSMVVVDDVAEDVGHRHHHQVGKDSQTKPSRFMLGADQPPAAQQLHLDLVNVHRLQTGPSSDFRMTSTAQNTNKWSSASNVIRQAQGSSSSTMTSNGERVAKLDGPPPPLVRDPGIAGTSVSHNSNSNNPFRRLSRPGDQSVAAGGPPQRRSDVRRVNLNRNPVSDYMHTFRA